MKEYIQKISDYFSVDLLTGHVYGNHQEASETALDEYEKDFLIKFPFRYNDNGESICVGSYKIMDKKCPYHEVVKNKRPYDFFKLLVEAMPIRPLFLFNGKPEYRVFLDGEPHRAKFNIADSSVVAPLDYEDNVYLSTNGNNNRIYREYGLYFNDLTSIANRQATGAWPEMPFKNQKLILDYINTHYCAFVDIKPQITDEGIIYQNQLFSFFQLANKKWILKGPIDKILDALKITSIEKLRETFDPTAKGVFPEMETKEILINKIKNIIDVL